MKKWKAPKETVQRFEPCGYISACGILEDGTILYTNETVKEELAYNRTPAGQAGVIDDDELSNEHKIYMGSFYRDKEMQIPDSTHLGHVEQEDWGALECVRGDNKSPWGYHYHFLKVTGRS